MGSELDGSTHMHIHHALRGGLLTLGIGIGAMSLTAAAGIGTSSAPSAPAAGRAGMVDVDRHMAQAAPSPVAPAATPISIEATAAAPPSEGAKPASWPEPDRPVVQAGPGPATPVEGATTLIDPLVIER